MTAILFVGVSLGSCANLIVSAEIERISPQRFLLRFRAAAMVGSLHGTTVLSRTQECDMSSEVKVVRVTPY